MSRFTAGVLFLITSAVLYTGTTITAMLVWGLDRAAVKARGSGGWENSPTLPALWDNPFVVAFLVLGVALMLWNPIRVEEGPSGRPVREF